MIHYICDHCDTPFDEPVVVAHRENLGEFTREYFDGVCPICGCDSFSDADLCPKCGEAKMATEILCKRCRDEFIKRIDDKFSDCTAEEEELFDELMDGDTITNRRNWG